MNPVGFGGRRQPSVSGTSRISREAYVRFCERLGVKSPGPTRRVNFDPGESTHVQVVFEAVPTGTRVTVRHSGWATLRADHPVRHGKEGPAFIRMIGLWWGDLMTSFRELAAERLARVGTL